jgi:hypothetical protein
VKPARVKEFLMKVSSALPMMLWQFLLLFLLWAPAGGQAIQSLESIKSQAELDKTGTAIDAALFVPLTTVIGRSSGRS